MAVTVRTRRRTPVEERFWAKVIKGDGCWEWQATKTDKGYGRFTIGHGKRSPIGAHRFSWELAYGVIGNSEICVCHSCDNPACVRPDHLFLGTKAENNADMRRKGRGASPPRKAGTDHNQAKLNWEQVREIRVKCAEGARKRDLAREYGVDVSLIYLIFNRAIWRE